MGETSNQIKEHFVSSSKMDDFVFKIVWGCCLSWPLLMLFSFRLVFIPLLLIALVSIPIHKFKTIYPFSIKTSHFPFFLVIFLFLFFAFLSVFWSINRRFSFIEFLKVVPIFFSFLSLFFYFKELEKRNEMEKIRSIITGFLLGLSIMIFLLLLDRALNFKLMALKEMMGERYLGFAKSYSYSIIMLIISFGIIFFRSETYKWLLGPAYILLIFFVRAYDYDAATVSLFFAGLSFIFVRFFPFWGPKILRISLVSILILAPVLINFMLTPQVFEKLVEMKIAGSHLQRLELLEWSNNFIKEKPLIGHGFAQTRVLGTLSSPQDYGGYYGWVEKSDSSQAKIKDFNVSQGIWKDKVWHLHNGFMQIWVELGFVGIILLCAFIWFGLKEVESFNVSPYQRALFYSALSAMLLIISVSFGMWQTWWLSTIGFILLLYYANFKLCEGDG